MPDPAPDWTEFTRRIFIAKPVDEVYRAWSIPANLTRWFLEEADYWTADKRKRADTEEISAGDRHIWKWHNWDLTEEGKVLKANGKDAISFTFGSGGKVHLQFRHRDGNTELVLTQDQIPQDDQSKMNLFVGCSTGWTFWLTNLKVWLEHGITLHATGLNQEDTKHLVNS